MNVKKYLMPKNLYLATSLLALSASVISAPATYGYKKTYRVKNVHSLDIRLLPCNLTIQLVGTKEKASLTIQGSDRDKHALAQIVVENNDDHLYVSFSEKRESHHHTSIKTALNKRFFTFSPSSKYTIKYTNKLGQEVETSLQQTPTLILKIPATLHTISLQGNIKATIKKGFFTQKNTIEHLKISIKSYVELQIQDIVYTEKTTIKLKSYAKIKAPTFIAKEDIDLITKAGSKLFINLLKAKKIDITAKDSASVSIKNVTAELLIIEAKVKAKVHIAGGNVQKLTTTDKKGASINTKKVKATTRS